jgi:hypothetical protein
LWFFGSNSQIGQDLGLSGGQKGGHEHELSLPPRYGNEKLEK